MRFLESLPHWGNIAVFCAGAVVVWLAGTRLSRGADAIADRTGLGQAFVGALLLGGTTSLPEIAATVSASLILNAPIAVNNIFGGIAMQVTILAMADALGRGALTGRNRHPGVLLEGTLLILVLNTAAVGIAVGDTAGLGVGLWTAGVLASLAVLAGGFAVAKSGERIAEQTGLGASFVGAILIAVATSLPEVSTTLEAVRLGARVMAISNIFGTNLFDAGLLFVADVFYPGPPVLNEVGRFAQVGALLGIACTTIYLAGILERRVKTFLRLGMDSLLVLAVYGGGVALLYAIR